MEMFVLRAENIVAGHEGFEETQSGGLDDGLKTAQC